MKAILVPTDFSDTAKNAAIYAIELARQVAASKIILYNAYQAPFTGDPTMPVIQLFGFEELQKISADGLINFKNELLSYAGNVEVETLSEFAILADGIDEACKNTGADLIVMGITGGSGIDVLVGSNTISVAEHSRVPVIIIPPTVTYKPIESVVLVCDFKNIGAATPVHSIKNILNATNAKLHVLNIAHHNKAYTPETPRESFVLDELLQGYNPQYHYVDSKDFSEAVNEFANNNHLDMIITIPKKHGFFENIFRKDHTKQLAFHTHVPLMCIHEEDAK